VCKLDAHCIGVCMTTLHVQHLKCRQHLCYDGCFVLVPIRPTTGSTFKGFLMQAQTFADRTPVGEFISPNAFYQLQCDNNVRDNIACINVYSVPNNHRLVSHILLMIARL